MGERAPGIPPNACLKIDVSPSHCLQVLHLFSNRLHLCLDRGVGLQKRWGGMLSSEQEQGCEDEVSLVWGQGGVQW